MSRIWQAVRRFISSIFRVSNALPRLPSNVGETEVPDVAPQDRSIRLYSQGSLLLDKRDNPRAAHPKVEEAIQILEKTGIEPQYLSVQP